MMLKKSKQQIITEALNTITENTEITNLNAGSIARSIIEATSGEYESLYEFAEDVLENGFLSTADDEHLDLIGVMMNYPRRTEVIINEETGAHEEQLIDAETYRYELSKRVTAAVSSNEEAIRLAYLAVPGVQNIIPKEYTLGTGSFSLLVSPLAGFDPETVKQNVEDAIQEVKAFGIRPEIILPTDIPLEIQIQLVLKETATNVEGIKYNVQSQLMNYFGNFEMAQDFIYNDFVQTVMNVDENIVDFKVTSFYLNDTPALLTNHAILEEERIRPRVVDVL